MADLNRNETITAFASAASLLIEQYITSERANWGEHFAALPVANEPASVLKAS